VNDTPELLMSGHGKPNLLRVDGMDNGKYLPFGRDKSSLPIYRESAVFIS
jgi:hypothetical protein